MATLMHLFGYLLRLPVSGLGWFIAYQYRRDDIPVVSMLKTYSPSTIDYMRNVISPLLIIGAILLLVPYWRIARFGVLLVVAALLMETLALRDALPMWDLQTQANDLIMALVFLIPTIFLNEGAIRYRQSV
ncbi:hypothetical protein [Labrys miyagiensis]|uniref:hypothetical protein n=1 Tax=Labrys miyagiensis TaxID=346912 RepID=UPI0024E16E09|nr:hypothetical protein [Labrys miyagiensis]